MALIGVIGAGDCDESVRQNAYAVGAGIARAGHWLICGGLFGVMEAACKGSVDEGGFTVGVLPGDSADTANPYVRLPIVTGMGVARNVIIIRSAAVLIAVSGGPGTLSEIAYALQFGRPVVSLGSWDVAPRVKQVATPDEAVQAALALLPG
jgi:uncharacterized protein (TIGR00725 family)